MVVLDATFLLVFLRPDVAPPTDTSGKPIRLGRERITHLVAQLAENRAKIVIPTPALSEALVHPSAESAERYVKRIEESAVFRIQAFDKKAAIEVATMARAERATGRKKGASVAPWAKVKYDRQIVAIAKVMRASVLYSDDGDVRAIAERVGISVLGVKDLPLPPDVEQGSLEF